MLASVQAHEIVSEPWTFLGLEVWQWLVFIAVVYALLLLRAISGRLRAVVAYQKFIAEKLVTIEKQGRSTDLTKR